MRFLKSHGLKFFLSATKFKRKHSIKILSLRKTSLSFCLRDSQILSAYTFGTLFGILQRAIQLQSCFFTKPLRVLLLRWAILPLSCNLLLAQYANNDFIIALVFHLSIPFAKTNVFFSSTFYFFFLI